VKRPLILKQFIGEPNVGDIASGLLVSKLLGRKVLRFGPDPLNAPNLLGIGSILNWADSNSVVWGSGCIAENALPSLKPRAIVAVRGPLTRAQLESGGMPAPSVLGDPGLLIADLYPEPRQAEQNLIALIPHYADLTHPYVNEARKCGVLVINPLIPLQDYLDALSTAEIILSSSLHGIVFAHALGRPAAWIELSDRVIGGGYKFRDYFASIGFDGGAPRLTANDAPESAARSAVLPRTSIDLQALREALQLAEAMLDLPG